MSDDRQLGLFSRPRPAETRRAAHAEIRPDAARLRARVLEVIRRSGPINCDAIEVVLGMSHQTCSARVHELAKAGAIVAVDKRPTRSGRQAIAWRVAS